MVINPKSWIMYTQNLLEFREWKCPLQDFMPIHLAVYRHFDLSFVIHVVSWASKKKPSEFNKAFIVNHRRKQNHVGLKSEKGS